MAHASSLPINPPEISQIKLCTPRREAVGGPRIVVTFFDGVAPFSGFTSNAMIFKVKHGMAIFSPNYHHVRSDAPDEHSCRLHAHTYPQVIVDKREVLILIRN